MGMSTASAANVKVPSASSSQRVRTGAAGTAAGAAGSATGAAVLVTGGAVGAGAGGVLPQAARSRNAQQSLIPVRNVACGRRIRHLIRRRRAGMVRADEARGRVV